MNIKPREYQQNIYNSIIKNGNSLVVLPTGLGKTLIALMLIENKLSNGKIIFLAPTKPLVEQHFRSVIEILDVEKNIVTIVTGALTPSKRKEEYKNKKIIVATPQTIRNDLKNKLIKPKEFSLIIFDEAHRAVGEYAYTSIAEEFSEFSLMVGLTASPGGKKKRINEVLSNLFLTNIELRTTEDKDIKQYIHKTEIFWQFVDLPPEYKIIRKNLDILIRKYAKTLTLLGFPPPLKSKTQFMLLKNRILKSQPNRKFAALLPYAVLLNLLHMTELLETQSLIVLQKYIINLKQKTTKSAKILLNLPQIKNLLLLPPTQHPKMTLLLSLIKKINGKKAMIFAQYREQINQMTYFLNSYGFSTSAFMGKKDKYTRKIQEKTIAEFREGKFNILCSSSIGEEGLDIPSVDVVIFYEPIPSEIRSIQRRGRTSRFSNGQVYILITKNSRDEFFYWASKNREKKMKFLLSNPELLKNTRKTKKRVKESEEKKIGQQTLK